MTGPPNTEAEPAASRSRWGRVVGGNGADRTEAFTELAASYWYCVYAWWRRAGLDANRAATLASFTRWLGESPPTALDSGAARLREWLLARLAELARHDLEWTGTAAIKIDPAWAEQRYADEPAGEPDVIFLRRWAITVVEFTASTLRAEYAARGEEALFAELMAFAGLEPGDEERYAAGGARVGRSGGAMHKAVFDFRTRQREVLRAFMADIVLDSVEADGEIQALLLACDDSGSEAANAPLPAVLEGFRPAEAFARALRGVRMTGGAAGGWQPPTIREAARLFPQYEVLSLLGRGGMGAVYKARQVELDRLVAIKLLPLEVSVDRDFADRFRLEARAMAKLDHPNIISVYEFGATAEGHLFFVMAFVAGANLHDTIHGPGVTPGQALEIIAGVCDALAYAHGKGVVHRDIKPANVMVSLDGQVKVADFGLARLTDSAAEQPGYTVTGTVMGTPDYMAPEQTRRMDVDHRADIYSLGVVLYEMLCREAPHGVFALPSARVPGVDPRVDQVVIRAMQQQPELRYQSTREMKSDVVAAAAPRLPSPKADPARTGNPQKSRKPLLIGVAALLAVAGAGIFLAKPKVPPGPRPALKAAATTIPVSDAAKKAPAAPAASPTAPEVTSADPTPAAVASGLVSAKTSLSLRAVITANSPDAFRIEDVRKGTKITFQFIGGKWKSFGRIATENPDVAVSERGDACRLVVALPSQNGVAGSVLAMVPPETQQKPFVFEAAADYPKVVLRINDEDNTYENNPGSVEYAVKIVSASATPEAKPVAGAPTPVEVAATTPAPKSEMQKWLDQVDAQYREPYQREVVKPYEAGMAQLKQGYLASIERLLAAATQAGKLEDAVALRGERQRLSDGAALRADDSDAPLPSIRLLRAGYRAQAARLDAARTQGAAAQFERYDKVLGTGQVQLTQRQRLDDALLLKAQRERIASEWLGKAPESAADRKPVTGEIAGRVTAASKDAPFVNTLGMKFVPVPIIGGPTGGQRVLFSVWDTRVQDCEVFAKETKREWPKADFPQGPTHPAVMVSWDDAQRFCQWLTARDQAAGRLPADWRYRLPSDHEWSCAVELGASEDAAKLPADKSLKIDNVFPWGTQWPPPPGAGNYAGEELRAALAAGQHNEIKDVLAGYNDGFVETSPVGSFKANRFGLYDLGGNVWQWCEDWRDQKQIDHVLRGGSWTRYLRNHLLSSYRFQYLPGARFNSFGFRCVLDASARAADRKPPAVDAPASVTTASKEAPFVNPLGMRFVPVPIAGGPTGNQRVLFSVWDTRVQDYEAYLKDTKTEW